MKTEIRLATSLILLLSTCVAAKTPAILMPSVPTTLEAPLAGDPMGVTIHRLPNGLTVYLSPNKGTPRVTAWIAVRAGSKNDPADATGQAHYLEHMLFKGTTHLGTLDYAKEAPHLARINELYVKRAKTTDAAARAKLDKLIDAENVADSALISPNEISRFYQSIGATGLNAFTSNEETVYVITVPSNRLEAWATLESERFAHPVFRLFPGELETVYEEKNRSLDNAERILGDEVHKQVYKAHPYGTQTTLGTVEHLKNPSFEKMQAFYDRWYVPNNMAIVLSGDFDPNSTLELISRRFGSWTPKPLPPAQSWPLPAPHGEERSEVKYEAEEKVTIAWPTVPASHPDADALTVMDMLVDNSHAGLLNLRLNQAQKVKYSGSETDMRNDAGHWEMSAATKKDQTPEQALALLLESVDALKNGEFTNDDIAAALTQFEIHEKRALESNEARASIMTQSFVSYWPWEKSVSKLERLRHVTKDDVLRVAKQYLGPDRIVVFRRDGKPVIPKIDKPGFSKLAIDPSRESEFLKTLSALPAKPIEPRWLVNGRDYQIAPVEGGRIFAAKNPYNDLFQLTISFERGWRHERTLCQALELLDHAGAGPYGADEFKTKLYALGTVISYDCGEQSSAVSLSGLDRNLWPTLELMALRFDWPNISTGTLQKMIEVDLGARQDDKKNPDAVNFALGQFATRGRESVVLARLTDGELKGLDESRLVGVIRDFPHWQRRVAYVGPRTSSEIAKLLEMRGRYKTPPTRSPLRLINPQKTHLLFTPRDMVQSRVGLMSPDEVYNPEHYIDYAVYSQYMGGDMSSVIFQEVREARSLAYFASGGHSASANKGDDTQLWGSLGCQADKTPEAVELMLGLFSNFPSSETRFRRTLSAIEESYRTNPIQFRGIPGSLISWEDEGLQDGDPRPARFARVLKYTLPEAESFAKRFHEKPMTVWVVGQRDRIGVDRLKGLGEFEEKSLAELFPY